MSPSVELNKVLIICGKDTHFGFSGNILNESSKRGFCASIMVVDDQEELDIKKIEESMSIIVVFSKSFRPSGTPWDNISAVVNQGRMSQLLLSVGHYMELSPTEVPASAAFHFPGVGNTYEFQLIENILMNVSEHVALQIEQHDRVKKLIQLLNLSSASGVHLVGMCGDPGMGLTTIARAGHELIATEGFDVIWYYGNVGENLRKHGSERFSWILQPKVVDNNCKELGNFMDTAGKSNTVHEIGSFQEGMSIMKHTLNQKKVLFTFDGIDNADVMQAVVEVAHDLGPGSRVVLTSPDKDLFEGHGIQNIYVVEGLDRILARQVLCLYAFGSMNMNFNYMKIIHHAEILASGNPSALKAIGSDFHGKTSEDCESTLEQYKQILNADSMPFLIGENNQIQLPNDTLEDNLDYGMLGVQLPKIMESECFVTSSTLVSQVVEKDIVANNTF